MVNILIVNMYLLCMILGCFFFSTFYLSSVACFFHFTSISYGWDLEWVAHIEKYKYSKWKLCCHPKPWKGGGERSPIVNMYLLCIILRCCFFSILYLSTIACGFFISLLYPMSGIKNEWHTLKNTNFWSENCIVTQNHGRGGVDVHMVNILIVSMHLLCMILECCSCCSFNTLSI